LILKNLYNYAWQMIDNCKSHMNNTSYVEGYPNIVLECYGSQYRNDVGFLQKKLCGISEQSH
jgi:hypothetical protein